MNPTDLTIEILKSIRDEAKATNGRLDVLTARVDQLSERVDLTNERLDRGLSELAQRIVHSEIRTATAIADLVGDVREMTGVLRNASELRPRVERCEHDIADLRARLDAAGR